MSPSVWVTVCFALAYVQWMLDWDWPAVERGMRTAIALDPDDARAHVGLGHALSQSGRHAEARAMTKYAQALDPLDPLVHAISSQVAYQAGEYAEALEQAQVAIGPRRGVLDRPRHAQPGAP